jgi:hypothetical protein
LGIHFGGYGIKVLVRTDPGCGVGDWQRNCGIDDAMAPGRIDVYAASFADRDSAKNFLKKVHSQYPHHRDAWILKY